MQERAWEREYKDSRMMSKEATPQTSVKDFFRWLKREAGQELDGAKLIDLGSGTGRNANYAASLGASAVGIEISKTAVELARTRAAGEKLSAEYVKQSIGDTLPFPDASFDVALDVTSSNSLNEPERAIYLKETHRVLKPGGHLFVRALCKDGDKNAQNLIKMSPGPEKDTYYMKELDLIERVFSKEDFVSTYSPYFDIVSLEKDTHYARLNGQSYKRNYWIAYLKRK